MEPVRPLETPSVPSIVAWPSGVADPHIESKSLIDKLFRRLGAEGHEFVLFDINRHSEVEPFFVPEPEGLTQSLLPDAELPFTLTLITNVDPDEDNVHALHKAPFSAAAIEEPLDLAWPSNVYSLSYVAVPFPPDDPLYGECEIADELNLGCVELRGERGLLAVPIDQLTRLRYNPFYPYLIDRVLEFLSAGEARD